MFDILSIVVIVRLVFLVDKTLLALLFSFQHLLVLLGKHLPRRARSDPTLELTLLLGMRVISNVTQLHRDLFVGFQEQRDRDRQQEVV